SVLLARCLPSLQQSTFYPACSVPSRLYLENGLKLSSWKGVHFRITDNPTWEKYANDTINNLAPQTLMKYPVLLDAMKEADQHLQQFNEYCQQYPCMGSLPIPIRPFFTTHIPRELAETMINDLSLNFTRGPVPTSNPESAPIIYGAQVDFNGTTYVVMIYHNH
ncbi:MAG: hypothetical protein ABI348_02205, partial [Nitrososphaera sp.]